MRRIRKLFVFARRERRLVRELRPEIGLRRAIAARARANLELEQVDQLGALPSIEEWTRHGDERPAEHDPARAHGDASESDGQALAAIGATLESLPGMRQELEGLAARIDQPDAVTAEQSARLGPASTDGPAAPEAPPASTKTADGPKLTRRGKPRGHTFAKRKDRLRILGVNQLFPLISETYIREELTSLVQFGVDIAWYRHTRGPAPMPVPEPVFDDFEEAIEAIEPDLAMVHWLVTAEASVALFEQYGLPFGVRAHSFDADLELMRELMNHPLCIGIWAYPAPEFQIDGAHSLVPIFSSAHLLLPPAQVRDTVVSISAGLPKKDWPLLLDAFDRILEGNRRLIIGITNGHEDIPGELARACEELANPPLLQVNVVREEVLALLARTAVSIYTLRPEATFGMPMSIADALCAGCSVVVPDRPEALAYAGPNARPYRTADDIAAHVHEVLAGGPSITAEWEYNREYGLGRFCDPETPRRFNGELRAGLAQVRANRSSAART